MFGQRRRSARHGRVPVYVITGFLGAGKTTLLKRLLATPEGAGSALIVNEFGEAGIDDALLSASADETVLLGNGCLCCSSRSDLEAVLYRLVADRDSGRIPEFKRIIIETSGAADPTPILQTFLGNAALRKVFHVESLTTLVDAVSGRSNLSWSIEARRQVMLADQIILTKLDLADADDVYLLRDNLAVLNRTASVGDNGADDAALSLLRGFCEGPAPFDGLDLVPQAAHTDGLQSFTLTDELPADWSTFEAAMTLLLQMRGADLLRVKGFLNLQNCRGPVLVQTVQHVAHPPIELASWPVGEQRTRLVFITKNLGREAVADFFRAVTSLSSDATEGERVENLRHAGS